MKKILSNQYLIFALRAVVGIIFIFFAAGKISEPLKFADQIGNYGILPESWLNIPAIILPWIELFAGFYLLLGVKVRTGALLSGLLLIVFTVAVAVAFSQGLDISCGCSGNGGQKVGWGKIIENLLLTLACVTLYIYPQGKFALGKAE